MFALNMISHAALGDVLLESTLVGIARAELFNTLASKYLSSSISPTSALSVEGSDGLTRQSRMDLMFLCDQEQSSVIGTEYKKATSANTISEALSVLPDLLLPSGSLDEDFAVEDYQSELQTLGPHNFPGLNEVLNMLPRSLRDPMRPLMRHPSCSPSSPVVTVQRPTMLPSARSQRQHLCQKRAS